MRLPRASETLARVGPGLPFILKHPGHACDLCRVVCRLVRALRFRKGMYEEKSHAKSFVRVCAIFDGDPASILAFRLRDRVP